VTGPFLTLERMKNAEIFHFHKCFVVLRIVERLILSDQPLLLAQLRAPGTPIWALLRSCTLTLEATRFQSESLFWYSHFRDLY
jgi:hypothetical protein